MPDYPKRTLKQWAFGGPEEESSVDIANRLTSAFVERHQKKFNPDYHGSKTAAEIEDEKLRKTSPM